MILIVDDSSDLAENCAMMLEACGYEVTVALSAEAALCEINMQHPDLLISDCCMPGMSGIELCSHLRSCRSTADFPIILMSSALKREVAVGECYDAFMRKPFLAEKLIAEVKRLLPSTDRTSGVTH